MKGRIPQLEVVSVYKSGFFCHASEQRRQVNFERNFFEVEKYQIILTQTNYGDHEEVLTQHIILSGLF